MAQTQAIVHYSTGSKILRRIIFPDDDSLLAATQAAHPPGLGESQTTFTIAPNVIQAAQNRVKIVGATAVIPTGRCVVIGPLTGGVGNVIDVLNCDLAIDDVSHYTSQGLTVVASNVAGSGWTWSAAGGFVAPPSGTGTRP